MTDTPTPTRQPTNTPIVPDTPTPTTTPIAGQKRIMFDETHGERNTLSWQRAQELAPDHPEWVYFGDLFWGLHPEFALSSIMQGPITYDLLSWYDAVIFSAPEWSFTESELVALERYLASGGGVLVIGDSWMGEAAESLTSLHGVTFNPYVLFAPGSEGDFEVTDFVAHPALETTDSLVTNWGGSLIVDSPAAPLAYTPPDIRRDVNQNNQYDASDPAGRFIIAAARESGPVRVVVTSDNPFQNDGYADRNNEDFVRSVLRWLTADRPAYAYDLVVPLVMK